MSEYRLKIHLLLHKCDHDLQPLTSDVNFLNFPNFSFQVIEFCGGVGETQIGPMASEITLNVKSCGATKI